MFSLSQKYLFLLSAFYFLDSLLFETIVILFLKICSVFSAEKNIKQIYHPFSVCSRRLFDFWQNDSSFGFPPPQTCIYSNIFNCCNRKLSLPVQVLMLHNVVSVRYAPYPKSSVKVVHRVIQCLPVCHSVTQFAQGHTVLDNISVEFRRKNLLVNLLICRLRVVLCSRQECFSPKQPVISLQYSHTGLPCLSRNKSCHKNCTDSNFCLKMKILTQKCYSSKIVLFSCAFPPNRLRREEEGGGLESGILSD